MTTSGSLATSDNSANIGTVLTADKAALLTGEEAFA
jgi:hypothetical protein